MSSLNACVVIAFLISASVTQQPASNAIPFENGGFGWQMLSLDFEVSAAPRIGLRISGMTRLRLQSRPSRGPNLGFWPGSGMTFIDFEAPSGAAASLNAAKDWIIVRFRNELPPGTEITIGFTYRNAQQRNRRFAINEDGVFASWGGGGRWYPVAAPGPGERINTEAPGVTKITVPAKWRSIATGRKLNSAVLDGNRTETWETTQSLGRSFLATDFAEPSGDPIETFLLPHQTARRAAYSRTIAGIIKALENRFGSFPFESFAVAALPASLAPPGFVGRSEPGYFIGHANLFESEDLNFAFIAHEVSHSWWGISVRIRPPGDETFEEGLAQYSAAVALESLRGNAAALDWLERGGAGAISTSCARGFFHLWRTGQDETLMASDTRTMAPYAKGPWVFHMLRRKLGDRAFFESLRSFAEQNRGRSVTLDELKTQLADASANREAFLLFANQWLNRTGAPVLEVAWNMDREPQRLRLTIRQRTEPFSFPLTLAIERRGGAERRTIDVNQTEQQFQLDVSGDVREVRLDPDRDLLLWRREYGPIPGITPQFAPSEFRDWFDREMEWLLTVYNDVPGISVGVVDNFDVIWTQGYGRKSRGSNERVTDQTQFQAGDLSQTLTALALLKLADQNRVDLDADVNRFLKSWRSPIFGGEGVTARQILSHRSGITSRGAIGFEPNQPLPDLVAILNGSANGKVAPMTISQRPGFEYRYNPGAFAILQQLIEDAEPRPFAEAMEQLALRPLGMMRSHFGAPASNERPAAGHGAGGLPVAGGWRIYPEQAAAGLWSTASDLALLQASLLRAIAGKTGDVIAPTAGRQLLRAHASASTYLGPAQIGLALHHRNQQGSREIYFTGLTEGYTALLFGFPDRGQGCVVLANNGLKGFVFALDVMQRIGSYYGWPSMPRLTL